MLYGGKESTHSTDDVLMICKVGFAAFAAVDSIASEVCIICQTHDAVGCNRSQCTKMALNERGRLLVRRTGGSDNEDGMTISSNIWSQEPTGWIDKAPAPPLRVKAVGSIPHRKM